VNRDEILSKVLDNVGVIAQGPIPPGSWAYNSGLTGFSTDINSAKNELSQAGMSSVTFTLKIASGSPQTAQLAQYIAAELAPAGITVNIQQETFAALLNDTSPNVHNYQAAQLGWSGRVDPDGNMYSWFHTGGGNNDMLYSNPQVDSLLEQARASSDQSTRATDYQQAEQLIAQDASYIFLYHGVAIQATTKNVQNYALIPTGIMIFTQTYLS
jgi:peptide/nickel transport system substrate-binding protein